MIRPTPPTLIQIVERNLRKRFTPFLFGITLLITMQAPAQGNLLLTPKRVVFEGNRKTEELNLVNIGKDTATYVLSFVQNRMTENGTFEKITQPDSAQNFADKNLRFFPRTVILAPNEAQTVKVQVTNSTNLQPGEYRSHLYFRAVPKETPLGEKEVKDTNITIKIIPVFGISIPTIIRKGDNNTTLTLSGSSLKMEKDTIPFVNTIINRTGNMSAYGDMIVDYISPEGKVTKVGGVKGLAVYTPTPRRKFQMRLENVGGIDYKKGKLLVRYTDQSAKPVTLAQEEISL